MKIGPPPFEPSFMNPLANPGGRYPDVLSDEEGQRLRAIEQRLNDSIAIAQDVPSETPTDWAKVQEMLHYVLTGEQS